MGTGAAASKKAEDLRYNREIGWMDPICYLSLKSMERSVRLIAALACLAVLSATSAVHAGWQQTRWGMNVHQVQKIVGPKATLSHGCTGVRAWRPEDKGLFLDHYRSGKFEFSVCLNVSPVRGLSEVGLVLSSPTDSLYDDLNHSLLGKYGAAFAHTLDRTPFLSENTEWRSGDTRITLNRLAFGSNDHPFVSIIYEPIIDANGGGL